MRLPGDSTNLTENNLIEFMLGDCSLTSAILPLRLRQMLSIESERYRAQNQVGTLKEDVRLRVHLGDILFRNPQPCFANT